MPRRGTPPPAPIGYATGGKNPFHFYKILFQCDKLLIRNYTKRGCNCKVEEWKCEDKLTSRQLCEKCQTSVWEEKYGSQVKDQV